MRISNTKSATKRCRRRSRAPPSLTAKRAAWTDRTGTGCLPRRLAGPSSSSRKPIIIFKKYWRRHLGTRKGGREKQLMVCTVYTMRIVVKLGKYIFYPMSLLSFTYIFSCCDCHIIQQLWRSVKYSIFTRGPSGKNWVITTLPLALFCYGRFPDLLTFAHTDWAWITLAILLRAILYVL